MIMKHSILLVLMVMLTSVNIFAKDIKRPESYNYQRGVELYGDDDYDQAIEYFKKELAENPKNGYANLYLGMIAVGQGQFGEAITRSQEAIKRIPKNDKEYVSYAYLVLGSVYAQMGEGDEAERNFEQAIVLQPDNVNNYYHRASFYSLLEQWDKAEADYRSIVAIEPGGVGGYMGLANCAMEQKHWDEAAKRLDFVLKLDPDYDKALAARIKTRLALKRYSEACDDFIKAIDNTIYFDFNEAIEQLADSALTIASTKLRVEAAKDPNNPLWLYCQAKLYEHAKQYRKAIEIYQASFAKEPMPSTNHQMAECYFNLGDGKNALEQINLEWQADTADMSTLWKRIDVNEMLGDFDAALNDADRLVDNDPSDPSNYTKRSQVKWMFMGDKDGALEDLNTAITLDPDNIYGQFQIGRLLWDMDRRDEALTHFERVQALDTVPEYPFDDNMYVYIFLGQHDKARQLIDERVLKYSNDADELYDCACAYSLLDDKPMAVGVLRRAFENGFRNIVHVNHDCDLKNIQGMAEYKALIDEYSAILATELETGEGVDAGDYEEQVVEVPFTTEGKVCKVKCTINGLPLHFIFDTGASQVSMSNVEATFMLKNDYLSSRDVMGKANYVTANGDVSEGTVVNLRDVNFGGLTLNNVQASIVRNQTAPLLLGQSVLSKLGKIEIDNTRHVLKITHRVKKTK